MVKHAANINPSSAVIRLRPVECERNWSELKCVLWWGVCAWGKISTPVESLQGNPTSAGVVSLFSL